jgi:heme-degrading monooxygenase HmoA
MTIAVFGSYVDPGFQDEHDGLYDQMHALVQQSPGYVSHKLFTASDGETVVIAEFTDFDSVETWGAQVDHKRAHEAGKDYVYAAYDVAVCEVVERHTKQQSENA